jgi:hypothetical protein
MIVRIPRAKVGHCQAPSKRNGPPCAGRFVFRGKCCRKANLRSRRENAKLKRLLDWRIVRVNVPWLAVWPPAPSYYDRFASRHTAKGSSKCCNVRNFSAMGKRYWTSGAGRGTCRILVQAEGLHCSRRRGRILDWRRLPGACARGFTSTSRPKGSAKFKANSLPSFRRRHRARSKRTGVVTAGIRLARGRRKGNRLHAHFVHIKNRVRVLLEPLNIGTPVCSTERTSTSTPKEPFTTCCMRLAIAWSRPISLLVMNLTSLRNRALHVLARAYPNLFAYQFIVAAARR